MAEQAYPIIRPGKQATLSALAIGLLAMAGATVAVVQAYGSRPDWWVGIPATLLLLLIFLALFWSMHRRSIALLPEGLRIRSLPWPRVVPLSELDLAQARIVDLEASPELRPGMKIAGAWLPGFRSGWFWLRDRRRAYVVLTDWRRVLMLPRRDGRVYLFSVERPDALLMALQDKSR